MKVQVESSRIVKPSYSGERPSTDQCIPLSVFDKVSYDTHMAVIYAFKAPTPPNTTLEQGLQKALALYREFAGRLVRDDKGRPSSILLNDKGVRFVEASVDCTLDQAMPLEPSMALLSFHPSLKGVEEVVQVQLTRFACGSMVVGFTSHHIVADGHSSSKFIVAWGQASRGLDMKNLHPFHDRSIFTPHDPPRVQFEHRSVEFKKLVEEHPNMDHSEMTFDIPRNVEFMSNKLIKDHPNMNYSAADDSVIVHKVHFTLEFLAKLKTKASSSRGAEDGTYSTFESLVAHMWRTITQARGLNGFETTHVRISVNGRARMNPPVPNEYFGNLVLWAFPRAKVKELLQEPLHYVAKLIHDAVVKVNDNYFKSFIDFASNEDNVKDLVPTADMVTKVLCPNLEVDNWVRFSFYDLDFGGGSPYIFMPSYFPIEGMFYLLSSFLGDGSIDAFVPLFEQNLVTFKKICYSLD